MRDTAGRRWLASVIAWLGLLGAPGIGCGKAEPQGSLAEADALSNGDASPEQPACAPPRASEANCQSSEVWARHPETGACCEYDGCNVPLGWYVFDSQDECQSSCRCAQVSAGDFSMVETSNSVRFETERISLECGCTGERCDETLDEVMSDLCATAAPNTQTIARGCGMIELNWSGGFVGSSRVFDAATGRLIGTSSFSDVPSRPCHAYEIVAGSEFVCEQFTECDPCAGDAGASFLPACD